MTTKRVEPAVSVQKAILKRALRKFDNSQTQLAKAIGCSQAMVWKLLNGKARVSVEMARKIHQATEGECPEYKLRPDFFQQPEEAA
tara:strand:+ start:937 stop:1194 length:258 start_codon:yes stop_codon:yes gene_type:complete